MPAESSPNTGHGLIFVPMPPMVRTILLADDKHHPERTKPVRFMFPHTMFGMFYFKTPDTPYFLKRLHVVFSKEPLTGEPTEKIYGLPIRNHDGAFATCFYNWPQAQDSLTFAQKVINEYWMSPYIDYNDWASWWTQRYKALNPTFFDEWIAETKKGNLDWIFEQDLLQADHHVNFAKLLEANKSHYAAGGIEVLKINPPKIEIIL